MSEDFRPLNCIIKLAILQPRALFVLILEYFFSQVTHVAELPTLFVGSSIKWGGDSGVIVTSVVDTGGKFAATMVDIGGKFATSDKKSATGDKFATSINGTTSTGVKICRRLR